MRAAIIETGHVGRPAWRPVDRVFFNRVLAIMIGATLGSGAVAIALAVIGPTW